MEWMEFAVQFKNDKMDKLKMGKTLATLLVGLTLLFSSLPLAKADWNQRENVYDVSLSDGVTRVDETPNFQSLESAAQFIPPSPYQDETVRINAYTGDYTSQTLTSPIILNNKQLVGKESPIQVSRLDGDKRIVPSRAGAVVVGGDIHLENNARIESMIVLGTRGALYLWDKSEHIENASVVDNYFTNNNPVSSSLALRGISAENINIEGNTFNGGSNSFIWAYVLGQPPVQNGTIKFRDNLFYGSEFGIHTREANGLDLGTEEDPGNNVFIRNRNNLKFADTPTSVPAVYNYWYGREGDTELKTREEDILDTVYVVNARSVSSSSESSMASTFLEVLPCYLTEPFDPLCSVKEWMGYE